MTSTEEKEEILIQQEKKETEEKLHIDISQTFSAWLENESELFYFFSTISLPSTIKKFFIFFLINKLKKQLQIVLNL